MPKKTNQEMVVKMKQEFTVTKGDQEIVLTREEAFALWLALNGEFKEKSEPAPIPWLPQPKLPEVDYPWPWEQPPIVTC